MDQDISAAIVNYKTMWGADIADEIRLYQEGVTAAQRERLHIIGLNIARKARKSEIDGHYA